MEGDWPLSWCLARPLEVERLQKKARVMILHKVCSLEIISQNKKEYGTMHLKILTALL